MTANKDPATGKWIARFRYTTWDGQQKQSMKRGFNTRRDALQWEREFLLSKAGSNEMSFGQFVNCYKEDMRPRLKVSTFDTKESIIDKKITPYFAHKPLANITTNDVLRWQNEMIKKIGRKTGKQYSKSYLKTLHNQLSAILNHGVKYYGLKENVASIVGNMGSEKDIKINFWTYEEYQMFADVIMEFPLAFYCFEVLYWCGIRLGEMLALNINDWDFENKTLSISKTYRHSRGIDYITPPKTPKSVRTIAVPDFLVDEIKEYISLFPDAEKSNRMFPVSKNFIEHKFQSTIAKNGLKRIRVHDLRHSHASLLINMGYSAVSIADRLGHESIEITYRYAHMYPDVKTDIANKLNRIKED